MATQALSPELLKILGGLGQTGGYADPTTGMYYQGTFSGQGGGEDTGYLTGYTASGGPTDVETARADTFGLDGNKTGNISAYDPKGLMQKEDWMGVLAVLGATLGGGALASGMGLQGGAAASGLSGGMGGSGAFLGEAPFTLSGAAPLEFGAASGAGGAAGGGALTAGGAGGSGSGLLSSVGLDGLSKYAGTAATLAGGLLGAKGNEQSSTSTKSLDPRMDPLVYGQGGLSSKIQELLNKQTSKSGLLAKYWS